MLSQRPLPDNTQRSQEIDIHASGWIRILNPSKRAGADRRVRPYGYLDRVNVPYSNTYIDMTQFTSCTSYLCAVTPFRTLFNHSRFSDITSGLHAVPTVAVLWVYSECLITIVAVLIWHMACMVYQLLCRLAVELRAAKCEVLTLTVINYLNDLRECIIAQSLNDPPQWDEN
jgi:hypothetical protein